MPASICQPTTFAAHFCTNIKSIPRWCRPWSFPPARNWFKKKRRKSWILVYYKIKLKSMTFFCFITRTSQDGTVIHSKFKPSHYYPVVSDSSNHWNITKRFSIDCQLRLLWVKFAYFSCYMFHVWVLSPSLPKKCISPGDPLGKRLEILSLLISSLFV